jgi:hypothetical protein
MPSIKKQPNGNWKATVKQKDSLSLSRTFRTRRDAEAWSRITEDRMWRGVYQNPAKQSS